MKRNLLGKIILLVFAIFTFIQPAQAESKLTQISDMSIGQFINETNKILMSEYGKALDVSLIDKPYRGAAYDAYAFAYNGVLATCYTNKAGFVTRILIYAKIEQQNKAPLQEAMISMMKAAGLQGDDPHKTVKENLYHIWCKKANRRFVVDMRPLEIKGQKVAAIQITAYNG